MPLILDIPKNLVLLSFPVPLSDQEFQDLCTRNSELLIEREPDGTLKIMTPVTFLSGEYESDFITDLKIWARAVGGGRVLSSSTGFTLPDNSVRSPDACWVSDEQLEELAEEEYYRYAKVVPRFVVEVQSKSDSTEALQRKMQETWIGNGVHLAWLVIPPKKEVFIYRADGSINLIEGFDQEISGEDVLPGFLFDLSILI